MTKLAKVWVNITTTYNWQRPAVGIVRVEREVAEGLKRRFGDRLEFCAWDGQDFVRVNLPSASTVIKDNIENSNVKENPPSPVMFQPVPRKHAVVMGAQAVYSLAPRRIRPFINRILIESKPWIVKLINRYLRRKLSKPIVSSQTSTAPRDNQVGMLFSSGDVLLSMGLDWDYSYYKKFYSLRKKGVRVVACCYDLIPVNFPQYCVSDVSGIFASYFLDVADGADTVLCISNRTDQDLNEFLSKTGGARPNTQVFPLGDNILDADEEISSEVEDMLNDDYILFVSTIERRKNHEVLYKAYRLLAEAGRIDQMPTMLFVGMEGWGVSELMTDIRLDPLLKGKFKMLSHVSDGDLNKLYKNALFCVFPSLYEGWGLPVGEALAFGKAVIASNRGSLPEVGGRLVTYVDPWDPSGWAEELHKMVIDVEYRRLIEKRVSDDYEPRSWNDACDVIAGVIDSELN